MNINLSNEDINFIICMIGMVIMAIMFTYMLNKVDEQIGVKKTKQD